jgi:hypothetical protein
MCVMIRTIFTIGVMALLGIVALNFAFGLFGFLLGLFGMLLSLAIKIAFFGAIGYVVLRIVAPDSARKLRDRVTGNATAV